MKALAILKFQFEAGPKREKEFREARLAAYNAKETELIPIPLTAEQAEDEAERAMRYATSDRNPIKSEVGITNVHVSRSRMATFSHAKAHVLEQAKIKR